MKNNISIALNIVLILVLVFLYLAYLNASIERDATIKTLDQTNQALILTNNDWSASLDGWASCQDNFSSLLALYNNP